MYNPTMELHPYTPEDEKPDVSIEAGHLYSPHHLMLEADKTTDEALRGLAIATRLRDRLSQAGYDSSQVFFVDDISPRHSQQKSMDAWRWQMFLNRPLEQATNLIEPPLSLMNEYDVIAPGLEIVKRLTSGSTNNPNYRISKDGRNLIYGTGDQSQSIPLLGYHLYSPDKARNEDYPDLPSCEVMDMATYRKRLKETGQTITLLPEWYAAEQDRVRKLFELLGEAPPIVTALYDERGIVTNVTDWSNGYLEGLTELVRDVN